MKPARLQIFPEPKTLEDVQALLWTLLRRRLSERRTAAVPIGYSGKSYPQFKADANGSHHQDRPGVDLQCSDEGRSLLADMMNVCETDSDFKPSWEARNLTLEGVEYLLRQGVIRPQGNGHFLITSSGARVLETEENLPLTSSGRVTALRAEFQDFPRFDVILKHFREAVAAYEAHLDYSSTVMIGACYESAIHSLAQTIASSERELAGLTRNKSVMATGSKLHGGVGYVPASEVEDFVRMVLLSPEFGELIPLGEDKEWVETSYPSHCLFVRSLRNKAGHPTGKEVRRDDIHSHILFFAPFLRRVTSIRGRILSSS